jgi:twitching motility protein PilT
MAKIDDLFRIMLKEKASDLHIAAGSPPCLRIHGEMVKLNFRDLTPEETQALLFEIITEKQRRAFIENWELDVAYSLEDAGRFRCNFFMQRLGMGAVFRTIPTKILSAVDLDLPHSLLDMINCSKGLILVTGPTGSGKSTTLAALINEINQNEKVHILTIEDPIEFVHQPVKALINQREISSHTKSFANALKAALREDPDIILVGEMRDLETIGLAITAAETGHLVFGTLHTNSAPKTVDRIIDVFPADQQEQIRIMLSESLRGVIAQGLLPRADKPGRVAVLEVLFNNSAVSNLIREGKTFQIPSIMQTGRSLGMMTFESHLQELVKKGRISSKDASAFLGRKVESTAGEATAALNGQKPGTQPSGIKKPA